MDKEWYQYEYWENERSLNDIAQELGISAQTVLNRMKKFGIKRRNCANPTKSTLEKQSQAKRGQKNPMYGKRRKGWFKGYMRMKMKGRTFSKETRRKMAEAKKGICGPAHNKWIPPNNRKGSLNKNVRRLQRMKEWREAIFERDDYTCQICDTKGGHLHADHIRPLHFLLKEYNITKPTEALAEPRIWDLDNGRTLCVVCHKSTKTYGAKIRNLNDYRELN